MKAYILIFSLMLLLSGCSITYLQYYRTESTNTTKTDSNFVFENDTVRITYSFWANGGVMSFNIFNKMDKPLYIDWKRSSFIINSDNLFYYNESLADQVYGQSPTGFIPPQTHIDQKVSAIVTKNLTGWNNFETLYQIRNDRRRKETKIFDKHYSKDNSPIVFRNFLTLSDRQDFQGTFTIDNGFYVGEMQAMDVRNFRHNNGDDTWEYYYKNGTDFFLEK